MTMEQPAVVRMYGEFQDIMDNLDQTQISLRLTVEEIFRKALLVAAGAYFEGMVINHLRAMSRKHSGGNELIEAFINNTALTRQFHTFFQWGGSNANSFFSLFGQGFKSYMTQRVNSNEEYRAAIRAFLEVGEARNNVAHRDFGDYRMEKTSEEIFELYNRACVFVNSLETVFDEYLQVSPPG